jgi:hypothetical protein
MEFLSRPSVSSQWEPSSKERLAVFALRQSDFGSLRRMDRPDDLTVTACPLYSDSSRIGLLSCRPDQWPPPSRWAHSGRWTGAAADVRSDETGQATPTAFRQSANPVR